MSIQLKPDSPVEAAVLFLTLELIDREKGTCEAVQFAREYEDNAPEEHFSVYLDLLEAGREVCCETGSSPKDLDRCADCAMLKPGVREGLSPSPLS
jgi:hypothetical protein